MKAKIIVTLYIKNVTEALYTVKDDRQRFLQNVSKKQFRTVHYNANACG